MRRRAINGIGDAGVNVATNVRRLRVGQGLSTARVSELLREHGRPLHETAITKIEHLNRAVDVDYLIVLARAFGVEPSGLLAAAPTCGRCLNEPPAGFKCCTCGAEG